MLVLLRHGESTANAAGVLLGRTDAPLTDKGSRQAAALGPLLGSVVRVVSSPLTRARDTAAGQRQPRRPSRTPRLTASRSHGSAA